MNRHPKDIAELPSSGLADGSLADREDRLRLALGSAGCGVWEWDIQAGSIEWSAGLEAIHGLAPGTFGGTFDDFCSDMHPDDKERVLSSIESALRQGKNHHVEYRIILPDGTLKWVEARGSLTADSSGKPLRMSGICMDVSRRKEAEELSALLTSVVESCGDAIISQSISGNILSWNESATRMFGYAREEALGQNVSLLAPQGLKGESESLIRRVQTGEYVRNYETRRRHKSGRILHVSASISPVMDGSGQVVGISKVLRDITEQVQARAREKLLADASQVLYSSLDYSTTLQNVAEISVASIADWCAVDIADDKGVLHRLAVSARDKSLIPIAEYIHRKFPPRREGNGSYEVLQSGTGVIYPKISPELIRQSAVSDEHCDLLARLDIRTAIIVPLATQSAVFGTLTFIGSGCAEFSRQDFECAQELGRRAGIAIENSQLYKNAQTARAAADAANEAKSTFLANMSHEIRTPLGAVLGFADLILTKGHPDGQLMESVAAIKRNGRLLSTVINDILDLSKVEAGKLTLENQITSLRTLLNDVRSTLNLFAQEKGASLEFEIAADVPDEVLTDECRLKQILNNIIGNAIKFSENGDVTLKVSLDPETKAVVFDISDNGLGLSEEERERLFQPFSQADSSTSRRFGGTGLGLVLSRNLARLMGGDLVLVSSSPGKGSIFRAWVSAVPAGKKSEGREIVTPPSIDQFFAGEGAVRLKGTSVLIVDDVPDNRTLISRFLTLAGATTCFAENGAEAVSGFRTHQPDIVLMDIQMPVMDGYAAVAELRKTGVKTPIIALTAHAMREEKDRCLTSGFNAYCSKPVDPLGLIMTIVRLRA